jgi:hypothetical protein
MGKPILHHPPPYRHVANDFDILRAVHFLTHHDYLVASSSSLPFYALIEAKA